MLFEKLRVFSCRRGDEHQEEGRESLEGRQPATHHEVRRLTGGFGERLWIFRWDSALITCVHTRMKREILKCSLVISPRGLQMQAPST